MVIFEAPDIASLAALLEKNYGEAIERAANDPRITVAAMRLDDLSGAALPQVEELAAALQTFPLQEQGACECSVP